MKDPQIAISQAVFIPPLKKGNKPPIIYLPGFSLSAKSKPVKKVGELLASKGFLTITLSTTPKTVVSHSLPFEATKTIQQIKKFLGQENFILVAHSKGASKAIAVLEQLEKQPLAVILITPAGMYPQDPKQLQHLFIQEVRKNAFPRIKKEFSKKQKPMSDLALGVLSMAAGEASKFLHSYPKRVRQETEELSISAPKRAKAVLQNTTIPVIIVYSVNDIAVNAALLQETIAQIKKEGNHENIHLQNLTEDVTHGVPYTHPEIVGRLVDTALAYIQR